MRIAIVGGGITGLAAARELERTTDAEIDLYEASPRLGGKLETERVGGLLVERGPDCFFTRKGGVMEAVRELGIEGRLVAPLRQGFSMLVGGRLHRVPPGLVALNAVRAEAVGAATFLSDEAKARALEPFSGEVEDDESIRAFFARRYGPEFARLVAEPLLAGTHGGVADRLSMAALFPAHLESARERAYAVQAPSPTVPPSARASLQGEPSPAFLSFDGGMAVLADALAASLARTRVHLNARLDTLPQADRTLVAIPANRAAALLPGVGLERVAHGTTSIATLAYRRDHIQDPLDATGFLVPEGEHAAITGATFSSAKWPGRAPEGTVLLRVFARGADLDAGAAHDSLKPLLGIVGKPTLARVDRWADAQPQYEMGHLERVAAIESRLPEGVRVAGTSLGGVGVPDCLRQGRDAARRIAQTL